MKKTVYILLFRGVGGATQLPVKPLREKLTEAGFDKVATYINSGNALLASGKGRETVRAEVSKICKAEFGFDKDIHVVTREEWADLIAKNPFPEALDVPRFLHAAVLAGDPPKGAVEKLREVATGGERIEVVGSVAYLHTPNGFGTSKLAVKFDNGIGVANTARNWNTVVKLMEMAEGM
ncbi:MAG: DUF1697 domain-containing protein [Mesorhizobium sp.]|nr:DUF1697 domain-containing protein [Mesorhizobium sp.]MCO5164336.1 DUF1697 domain-containing protein [Mesorhizobium sp.]